VLATQRARRIKIHINVPGADYLEISYAIPDFEGSSKIGYRGGTTFKLEYGVTERLLGRVLKVYPRGRCNENLERLEA
jgi:hypothetical protein